MATGGLVYREERRKAAFLLVPHTCGTQRVAFRDEPAAGVDHKFTSIRVVPSIDHLSSFTCRDLGFEQSSRFSDITDRTSLQKHKSEAARQQNKIEVALMWFCGSDVVLCS